MINKSLNRLLLGLRSLNAYLNANTQARELLAIAVEALEPTILEHNLQSLKQVAPSALQWRVMDHCSAIGRLYALFEQFVEGLIEEWVAFLCFNKKFDELPPSLQKSYGEGFIFVLENIDKPRYDHLLRDMLVQEYSKALQGGTDYRLAAECLNHHTSNLRFDEVRHLLLRVGIEKLDGWISSHPSLINHFESPKRVLEQTQSFLHNLVQYRNDAAHGAVAIDEIMGGDELLNHSFFIESLSQAINQLVNSHLIAASLEDGRAELIGTITKNYSNNICLANMEGSTLKCGERIILVTAKTVEVHTVLSLQLENVSVREAVMAKPTELGLGLSGPAFLRAKVVRLLVEMS